MKAEGGISMRPVLGSWGWERISGRFWTFAPGAWEFNSRTQILLRLTLREQKNTNRAVAAEQRDSDSLDAKRSKPQEHKSHPIKALRSCATSARSLASGAFERSMLGVSASLELVPILDQLFPQIALALAAPRASALVEQIRRELH